MAGQRRSLVAAFAAGVAVTLLVTSLPRALADSGAASASDPLAAVRQAYDAITQRFAGKVDPAALVDGAISGMAAATGDRFTEYFTPSQLQQFTDQLQGGYVGIGVVLGEGSDGYPKVLSVFPASPADQAGVRAGDEIEFVNGNGTLGQSLDTVAGEIKGPLGGSVDLVLHRPGRSDLIRAVITRGNVEPSPTVSARMLDGGLGYIRITQFDSDTGSLFQSVLQSVLARNPRGIVLDLRDDPGGYLSQAVAVAQLLVPEGPIVKVVDAQGNPTLFSAPAHPAVPHLAVLVNNMTASAAEILAGAIQARGVGVLVGQRTYGKGSVQDLIDLGNGGALKLTIAHDFTPAGRAIDGQGLTPDIPVLPPAPQLPQVPTFADIGGRVLGEGDIGLDVLGVQQRLAFLGYDPGPQDGIYGPRTEAAAAAFARDRGLPAPDGTLDLAFQHTLLDAVGLRVKALMAPPPGDPVLAAAEAYLLRGAR